MPISPVRVLDSRNGTGAPAGRLEAGCTVTLDLAASPVPANASAIALSVTSTEAAEPGYVTVFPCGSALPYASNLNPRVGDPTPNLVLVPVDSATRKVCLFTFKATHLVADLTGWFAPGGGRLHPVTPARLLDTRSSVAPPGTLPPPDGSRPVAATVIELPVAGAGLVPAGAAAVAVNVTVDQTAAPGYVTAFPCGTPPPLASNVNYLGRDTRSTQAMVGLGAGGRLCLFTYAGAHLIVDVTAWFEAPGAGGAQVPFFGEFTPVVAERLLDTRDGAGGLGGVFAAGEQRAWGPLATGRVARGANALVVNVTATQAAAPGFVRLAPCDDPASAVSSVNVVPGVDATNVAVVPLPFDGRVCVFSYAGTHVIVDLLGAFTLPALYSELSVTGPIWPELDPDVHDYAVQCAAGTNSLPARVVPAPGVAAQVASRNPEGVVDTGGTGGYGPAERTVALAEDDALVITLTPASGPADEYWFRCLPHDFPTLDVTITNPPAPGYYLLDSGVPISATPTASPFAIILDEHGVPVWYRHVNPAVIDVHRDSDGNMVWGQFSAPGFGTDPNLGYEVRRLDGTRLKLWRTVGADTPTDYHDIVQLPGGDRLMIGYRERAGTFDLASLPPDQNGNPLDSSETVVDSIVQRVTPDGSIVWEWNSAQVPFAETTFPMKFQFCGCVDLVHVNALDVAPNGDVLVSARNLDALLLLRPNGTGADIITRYGGTDSGVSFNDAPHNGFARPHDAHFLPNGNLMVFDNRTPRTNEPSIGKPRAVEYQRDGAVLSRVDQRDFPGSGVSFGLGSARRLPDGGLVVNWGGISQPAFGEYDAFGVQRLEITIGGGRLPYRVIKEPPATFDVADLRATAGRGP